MRVLSYVMSDGQAVALRAAQVVAVSSFDDCARGIWVAMSGGNSHHLTGCDEQAELLAAEVGGLTAYNLQEGGRVWIRPDAVVSVASTAAGQLMAFTNAGHVYLLAEGYDAAEILRAAGGGG